MQWAYISVWADRCTYTCPGDGTILAFIERTITGGFTYGLPHGLSIDTR
jgi:hypothetical protein